MKDIDKLFAEGFIESEIFDKEEYYESGNILAALNWRIEKENLKNVVLIETTEVKELVNVISRTDFDPTKKYIIPLNKGSLHWTTLILYKDGDDLKVIYADSSEKGSLDLNNIIVGKKPRPRQYAEVVEQTPQIPPDPNYQELNLFDRAIRSTIDLGNNIIDYVTGEDLVPKITTKEADELLFGKPVTEEFVDKTMMDLLAEKFGVELQDVKYTHKKDGIYTQKDGVSCGPMSVENAIAIVKGEDVDIEVANIVRQNPMQLRQAHKALFQEKQVKIKMEAKEVALAAKKIFFEKLVDVELAISLQNDVREVLQNIGYKENGEGENYMATREALGFYVGVIKNAYDQAPAFSCPPKQELDYLNQTNYIGYGASLEVVLGEDNKIKALKVIAIAEGSPAAKKLQVGEEITSYKITTKVEDAEDLVEEFSVSGLENTEANLVDIIRRLRTKGVEIGDKKMDEQDLIHAKDMAVLTPDYKQKEPSVNVADPHASKVTTGKGKEKE